MLTTLTDAEYLAAYAEVVGDSRFRLFGFTREDILLLHRAMNECAEHDLKEFLSRAVADYLRERIPPC